MYRVFFFYSAVLVVVYKHHWLFSMYFLLRKNGPCTQLHVQSTGNISTRCGGLCQVFVQRECQDSGSLSGSVKAGCQVDLDPLKYEAALPLRDQ